jgi:hypothetical protein
MGAEIGGIIVGDLLAIIYKTLLCIIALVILGALIN